MKKIPLFIVMLTVSILSLAWARGLALSSPIEVLFQLASPTYEGRGVGTEGLEKAKDLLVAQLESLGVAPAIVKRDESGRESAPRSYLQEFRVFVGNELAEGNQFAGSESGDFVPLAFSKSGLVSGEGIVFVGFGITARQEGTVVYDDYAGVDVKGKLVIALLGDPGTGNKDSIFRNPAFYHYSSPMYKVQNAELHGASGIVLVRDPLSLSGQEPPLRFQSRQGGGSTSSILAGQSSIAFAEKVLGMSLQELQEKISHSQRPFSFALEQRASLAVHLVRHLGNVQNVVGLIPGNDPALQNEYVVIGAHYDHLGYGGDSSMDPNGIGKIHPGADDNASGVQAVLHLAAKIQEAGRNRRPVLIVFFTAEEIGLLGSKNFTENLPLAEGAKVAAMLNLDMVGRLDNNKLSVLALRSGKEFSSLVEDINKSFGFDLQKGDSGFGSSDHASFLQLKIPSLFFTTGAHADYHKPSDTADKINTSGLLRVESFVFSVWDKLDKASTPPTYDPAVEEGETPPREGRGYGVYFGSVPEFNQGDVQGVLLQGVRPGSPAEQAGLQTGDVLTGLGEIKIKNLYDFVFALRFYRANEEVDVFWTRGTASMQSKAILRAREH